MPYRSVIAIASAVSALAFPTFALEVKDCKPFDEMLAALQAEGQHSVLTGDRVTFNKGPQSLILYTSNHAGLIGYELVGDRIYEGQNPPELCVRAVFTDIQIHNAADRTVPPDFRLSRSLTSDELKAATESSGYGGADYNSSLDFAAGNGWYPAIKAIILIEGKKANYLDIRVHPDDKLGSIATAWPDGFMVQTDGLENVQYRKFAQNIFARRAGK